METEIFIFLKIYYCLFVCVSLCTCFSECIHKCLYMGISLYVYTQRSKEDVDPLGAEGADAYETAWHGCRALSDNLHEYSMRA